MMSRNLHDGNRLPSNTLPVFISVPMTLHRLRGMMIVPATQERPADVLPFLREEGEG